MTHRVKKRVLFFACGGHLSERLSWLSIHGGVPDGGLLRKPGCGWGKEGRGSNSNSVCALFGGGLQRLAV